MTMQAGFYEADITPFYDTERGAERLYGRAEGVNTPFHYSAGVFENDGRCIAVVGADMIVLDRALVDFAEAELKKLMPLDALIVGASHTHANPCSMDWLSSVGGVSAEEIEAITDLRPEVRQKVAQSLARVNPDYRILLRKRLVDAVWNAYLRRQPVRLVYGAATVDDVAYNRRQKMKNGLTVTHAGKGNPDIVDYAGPVDTQLTALGAINHKDVMIGAVVNFGCHATVSAEKKFSADWPYYMRATVKHNINPQMTVVFLNGCCGDVTQIDNLDPAPEPRTEHRAFVLGERVGFGAIKALRMGEPAEFKRLDFQRDILPLNYRTIPQERYQKAVEDLNARFDNSFEIGYYARDTVLLANKIKHNSVFNCELNAVQIGNLILLTSPGEVFAQMSLDVKAGSMFPYTMVAELVNGHAGYIPTPEAFGPTGGGYEPRFGGGSFLEIGAFEKIRAKFLEMLKNFQAEKPVVKTVAPGRPWKSYRPEEL